MLSLIMGGDGLSDEFLKISDCGLTDANRIHVGSNNFEGDMLQTLCSTYKADYSEV
jgi:hypothetical protein